MEDAAMDEFKGLDTSDPNAVVVGLAPSKFNYAHVISVEGAGAEAHLCFLYR